MLPAAYISKMVGRHFTAALTHAIQDAEQMLLVAEEDGRVVGVAHTAPWGSDAIIMWKLYIARPHQGRGTGSALIEEIARRASGSKRVLFTEYFTPNVRAGRFYANRGFAFSHVESSEFHGTVIETTYVRRRLQRFLE